MCAKRRIVFRADGNADIGLGHVVRSLALADILRENFDTAFAIQAPTKAVSDMILKVCHRIFPLEATNDLRQDTDEFVGQLQRGDIVVLDGYGFDKAYQQACRDDGHRILVVIDDLHVFHMHADAVINHGGGIAPSEYRTDAHTKLFLGPEYALLRKPFLDVDPQMRALADPHQYFICMGGADPHNLSRKALEALARVPDVRHALVVVGSANPHQADLEAYLPSLPFSAQILHNLDAKAMCSAMQTCGSAIAPSSSVSMEACAVGMRLFAGHYVANQVRFADFLASRGLSEPLGDLLAATPAMIATRIRTSAPATRMIKRQQTIFGGRQRANLFSIFKPWI